jgi:tRNA dimethylallyltransferase
MNQAIIICGPTSSGKTAFAHALAKKHQGEIVSSDAMQIYKQLPILTASPTQSLKSELPYHLYNFLDINEKFSLVRYALFAAETIKAIVSRGKLPIIVGGSGMYINSLVYGYNIMPEISSHVREGARKLHSDIGQEDFFKKLKALDPLTTIKATDKQKSIRAYEVFIQTGQSITIFQKNDNVLPLQDFSFKIIFLCPERHILYAMCNERLSHIFRNGALEEVRYIRDNFSNIESSAMKAIGLQEILAYLDEKIDLNSALILAQNKTRQYAKRQITWFKHQIKEKIVLDPASYKQFIDESVI